MPQPPALSRATEGLSSSVYTSLLALAQTHAAEIFPLNVGDTYLLPPECARSEHLHTKDLPGLHNYAAVQGEPALFDAIVDDFTSRGLPLERRQIQVTAGATSGLDIVCRTLFEPGDEVIVLTPYWPLIRGIVRGSGASMVELPCFTELRKPGFDLAAALASVVSERTAGIYVNHPNNPTGVVLDAREIAVLADFTEAHNLWLINDAAYEQLSFEDTPPIPLWTQPALRERTVTAHTFSKCFGMAGARVGFVHGPERPMAAIGGLQTFATYCAPKPMQHAMARALRSSEGASWTESARSAYAEAALRTSRVLGLPRPQSGTFAFFDTGPFLRAGETPVTWLERCARAGIVLTPGAATGEAYASWARLCFTSVPLNTLDRALTVLNRALRET
ncbi:MAG: pyridoxal phosphate-dependent aminotransferase [Myxococcales bacterium]